MGYDFQDSKGLTSILWRHSDMKFSDGSRNNYSIYSSHLCFHERAGWGRPNWICPRTRVTLGTPLPKRPLNSLMWPNWWNGLSCRSEFPDKWNVNLFSANKDSA